MPNGLGTLWARCPLAAAKRAAEKAKIAIGWTMVRLETLDERPLQCYKCLQRGHVQAKCSSTVNRPPHPNSEKVFTPVAAKAAEMEAMDVEEGEKAPLPRKAWRGLVSNRSKI